MSRFSVENFLSHSPENFRRGIPYCSSNVGHQKGLDKNGEYQDFPSKNFCLTVPKIFVGESFFVALFLDIEKDWERRGEYQDFLAENFCVTVPNFSIRESFIVALNSGTEKVWRRGEGSINIFRRKFFVSECRKIP